MTAAHPSKSTSLASLTRLMPYARPHLKWFIAGLASAIVASLLSLSIPLALEWIIAGPIATRDLPAVILGGLIVLGLGVGEALLVFLRRWFVLGPATKLEYEIRVDFYNRLQRLPVGFHDRWQGGQLLSRMMQDTNRIRRWIAFGLVLIVTNLLTVVVGTVLLFQWHWVLGLFFVLAGLPIWVQGFRFERRYGALTRLSQDQTGDLATSVEESVHGIRVLKAFGRGPHALRRFTGQAKSLRGTEMQKAGAIARIDFWLLFMPDVAMIAALFMGGWLFIQNQLDIAQLLAYFAMTVVLRWPMESIGFLFSFMLDAATSTTRLFEVFDEVNTITDPDSPRSITEPQGRLSFNDVHFRYGDARENEPDLLNGVTLEIEPGETMALVGLTGSGKTTLTTLPTRLYDVTAGSVMLDGHDVRDLTLDELRTHISTAFEDATLFSASVRDNVLLGRNTGAEESARVDSDARDRDMRTALAVAQADFVDRLPRGADTLIGEEGLSLSGGQRQRLALARAVAARPSVIVMDDPLSALDVDTEERVQRELRRELAGTTALIVAHRPSTVVLADRVALLQDGRILAVGTHTDLMISSPEYRNVISSLDEHTDEEGQR